jgi:hypothetical protein
MKSKEADAFCPPFLTALLPFRRYISDCIYFAALISDPKLVIDFTRWGKGSDDEKGK